MLIKVIELLHAAKASGIDVVLHNDQLELKVPKGKTIDHALIEGIKQHKESIIDYLRNDTWQSGKVRSADNAISPFNRSEVEYIPLSFAQERLWFIDTLQGSRQYHMPAVFRLTGSPNPAILEEAFKEIICRHEVLRTVIRERDGSAYQYVKPADNWQMQQIHAQDILAAARDLEQYIDELVLQPFDLSEDFMLRVALITLSADEHILVMVAHHIAFDGGSVLVMVRELVELYRSKKDQRTTALLPLPVQYTDYSMWQRRGLTDDVLTKKLQYWKNQLQGLTPLELLPDRQRPAELSIRGGIVHKQFNAAMREQLISLSEQEHVTLFMTLLCAFKVLLYRYTGQTDICIGIPVEGRHQQELEDLIGFFVNTLAVRSTILEESGFSEQLQQLKQHVLSAYEHQDVPFEKVVEALGQERDMSRHPVFDVMFTWQGITAVGEPDLDGIVLTRQTVGTINAKFDIHLDITESAHGLEASLIYRSDLFEDITMRNLLDHYEQLLQSILTNSQMPISRLTIHSKDEAYRLLHTFNGNTVDYPPTTITELFDAQVRKTPDAIAVISEGEKLTYSELDERANRLAYALKCLGVKEETPVPVCVEKSPQLIIGLLGIIKSGGAWVPIAPDFPEERIKYILEDIGAGFVVTDVQCKHLFQNNGHIQTVYIDEPGNPLPELFSPVTACAAQPHHLAYVMYTSGSTGMPKGVMIEHASLANYLLNCRSAYVTESNTGSGSFIHLSFTFDASLTALFVPLIAGKSLVIGTKKNTETFSDELLLSNAPYDFIKLTPAHLPLLQEVVQQSGGSFVTGKLVVGGEVLKRDHFSWLIEKGIDVQIINEYGPTEGTVGCCTYSLYTGRVQRIQENGVWIGKPINNVRLYIVNKNISPVPVGVAGELCIGGVQVARGYWHQPELTQEKFIPDPFCTTPGARLYKTGDMARWLPDGNIEFLGRSDDQLKIRGYRIEPGEIEHALLQVPQVIQSVIVAKDTQDGSKQLIGYVVTGSGFDEEQAVAILATKLPGYMVPSVVIRIDSIPLTSNGKVDRKRLVQMSVSGEVGYQMPRNRTEEKLAVIWQHLLRVEQVGIHDNFFLLGGHSILAARVRSAIQKEFGYEVSVKAIFTHPTIAQFAGYITGHGKANEMPGIVRKEQISRIPLSFAQERLWFIDKFQGTVQYHIPCVVTIKGAVSIPDLEHSFRDMINRHEVLRTVLAEEDGQGFQHIRTAENWKLHHVIKEDILTADNTIESCINNWIITPFDLDKDVMLRAWLLSISEKEYILVVVLHHIAFDGWSTDVLINELAELYNSRIEERPAVLNTLPVQYADYAIWQRTYLNDQTLKQKLAYWKEKLHAVELLEIPADFVRPAEQSIKGAALHKKLDSATMGALVTLSQKNNVTLFITLLSAFKVLLYRYTGQSDICIGTPIAGRQQQELEGLIGFFANTLALRSEVRGNTPFSDLLQQVQQTMLDADEFQEVPFEKVVESLNLPRDISRSPLFSILFVMNKRQQNQELKLGQAVVNEMPALNAAAKFDITFNITESAEGLHISLIYCNDLYKAVTAERILEHYITLLQSVLSDVNTPVGRLPMINKAEEQQILQTFNDTGETDTPDKTIVACFEEQVLATPDAVALVFEERYISYLQLEEHANCLAHYLRKHGVKEGTLVQLCLHRCPEMVIGILGILKAGGAWVPIDPDYPDERIAFLLADTKADVVLTMSDCRSKLSVPDNTLVIELDSDWLQISREPDTAMVSNVQPHHLAYVIYTSGSTGKPKGVMIEHRGIMNRLQWAQAYYRLTGKDVVLQKTTFCFDISVWELLWPLITGARLVLAKPGGQKDHEYLKWLIVDQAVTIIHFVPSMLEAFLLDLQVGECKKLRHVLCSGEALKLSQVHLFREKLPKIALHNLYGPTEASIDVTCWTMPQTREAIDIVPIGKPIHNCRLYILNAEGNICPIGIAGDLYIGGVQVARGYLNRPELTAEKFIPDPFCDQESARLYYTGDSVRWLPDGNIEFIGRKDDQVKIRGYRIEPGETAHVLQQAPGVHQAVVLVTGNDEQNKKLVGFITGVPDLDQAVVMDHLRKTLPDYMVPALLIMIEQIPLTLNGKVDRKQLATIAAGMNKADNRYVAPRNQLEKELVAIWCHLLQLQRIGIYDNFFELGGHSILAIRVISAIRKKLGRQVNIKDIFVHPTVAGLATCQSMNPQPEELPLIRYHKPGDRIPLSFLQEQLWFVDRLHGSVQYHMAYVFRLHGKLDTAALEWSFRTIVHRHEVLRTVLQEEGRQVYQHIRPAEQWTLRYLAMEEVTANNNDPEDYIWNLVITPFDLSQDWMLRVWLIKKTDDEHILVTVIHHIAFDGWSVSVMVAELTELYRSRIANRAPELKELPVQYADFALWQRRLLTDVVMSLKLAYWKEQLSDLQPLKLLTDYPRPTEQSFRGGTVRRVIAKEWHNRLIGFSQREGVTLFMTLLGAFKILLYRYAGQSDIAIGCPIAGRRQQELEGLIGFFVNTLVLRSKINAEEDFRSFLQQLKQTALDAYEHQEVPFEKVAEVLGVERDISRHPIVDVKFQLMNMPESGELDLGELRLVNENPAEIRAIVDINLYVRESEQGLHLALDYCRDLYKKETMERMLDHYEMLLQSILSDNQVPVSKLQMLSPFETAQLTNGYNRSVVSCPNDITMVHLFEQQVAQHGGKPALVFEQEQLTYAALNEKANKLALYLKQLGVQEEEPVVVCVKRSLECIIGILGILKAGAAYVPVDDKHPDDRIAWILTDTGCRICLAPEELKKRLASTVPGVQFIDIRSEWDMIHSATPTEPGNINLSKPDKLVYIIYTSGSTGKPKGVMIEHVSLVDHVYGLYESAGLQSCDSFALFASLVADAGHAILFAALGKGAVVHVLSDDMLLDNSGVVLYLQQHAIDCIKIVPSLWLSYVDETIVPLPRKVLLFGGESFSLKIPVILSQSNYAGDVYNHYGPTETTIGKCIYKIDLNQVYSTIPIGAPFSNTQLYILDAAFNICPPGVAGELYIGGEGVARGYLNLPALTAEKFIDDTWSTIPGKKLYKTGDRARWLSNGNIEYLGRKDEQIKIRGHRIDPGEIENVLNDLPQVMAACVVARPDELWSNKLIGYYVPANEVVKCKEKELYLELVNTWKELYETENSRVEELTDTNEEFSLGGWNDSFTGKPIPGDHMREWLDDIMQVIFSGKPENVLEIGCGRGLIYYQLAGNINKYIGTDFSNASINRIRQRISLGARNYGITDLKVCAAHEVTLENDETVDTIIINSVVQYFPGEEYLSAVIDRCISLLKGKGRIIIGDVRDIRLLKLFRVRLCLEKVRESANLREFDWYVEQEILKEEELCISPDYFYGLQHRHPGITHVNVQWKQSHAVNELTLYRYTVVLYVGIEKEKVCPEWKSLHEIHDKENILQQLQSGHTIGIKDVYNPRLCKERALEKCLAGKSVNTIRELHRSLPAAIEECKKEDEVISEMIAEAVSKGYQYVLLPDEDPLKMNVLISASPAKNFIEQIYREEKANQGVVLTNVPLFPDICARLQKDIRSLLQQRLPDYMIPAEFIGLHHLPLMMHGKVDRAFLSKPEDMLTGHSLHYQAPVTLLEKQLTTIWQELLGVNRVGRHDNFFKLGGHSLLATRVVSAIRKELQVEITVKDFFVCPTIALLAVHIEQNAGMPLLPPVTVQTRDAHIPLSWSQERLWFIDKLQGSVQYHSHWAFRLSGLLNVTAFEESFKDVIRRHEVLRTVIHEVNGKGYQVIQPADAWRLHCSSHEDIIENGGTLQQYMISVARTPFDLASDYMLRCRLVRMSQEEHVLIVVWHHIASDGWSVGILVEELAELYRSKTESRQTVLKPLPIQYADYAIWQRKYVSGETLQTKLDYWKTHLKDVEPLQLHTDFVRPALQSIQGSRVHETISKTEADAIRLLANQEELTLFMTLLGVFKILLYVYTGQSDICIGSPIAGRRQSEVEGLIGFFVNTLALRSTVSGYMPVKDVLQQVKQITLQAYEHQEVPFENVVEVLDVARDMSRTPVFQVMFALQNTPGIKPLNLGAVSLTGEELPDITSKFDLSFNITEHADGLQLTMIYCTDLYKKETIEKLLGRYKELLQAIVINAALPVGELVENIASPHSTGEYIRMRGYRIDLQQVELVLQQAPGVHQAVVLAFEDAKGKKQLAGCIAGNEQLDNEAVTAYLQTRLPAYMVPYPLITVDQLPLTADGEIEMDKLQALAVTAAASQAMYTTPSNEIEENLTALWKELLKKDKIGIHDNYFELGGDSVIIIQLVSRARRFGYELHPKDIFTHQTISKLSSLLLKRAANECQTMDQALLNGSSGLLPVQQWYLDQYAPETLHDNPYIIVSIDKNISAPVITDAIKQLIRHHDSLRFAYRPGTEGYEQWYGTNEGGLQVEDLIACDSETMQQMIASGINKWQHSMDITGGELFKGILLQTPPFETDNRLLLLAHYLVADQSSWRILLEDLSLLLSGMQQGQMVHLHKKTGTYRQWYDELVKYGQRRRLLLQAGYWEDMLSKRIALPVDNPYEEKGAFNHIQHITVRLETDYTRLLLQEIPAVYHATVNDLMLAALGKTLHEWSGYESIIIGLNGQGRETIIEGIDISRTVGQFTTKYPVLLGLSAIKETGELIKQVKEQLRRTPDKGLGYGVLKYMNRLPSLQGDDPWEITFDYLDQADALFDINPCIKKAKEFPEYSITEERMLNNKMAVTGIVTGMELQVKWSYNADLYNIETIDYLATRYLTNLQQIITHCTEQKKKGTVYTPSDYGLTTEISYQELDRFINKENTDMNNVMSF